VDLSAWLQEFKRRRVFRALAGYGLISFALLQVVEPVMHGLNLPDWNLKVLVIGLGLGFPLTVLLAWAYDLKATGIERTPSIGGGGRGWRTVALIAIGLLLATPGVAWFLLRQGRAGGGAATDAGEGPSVAVLPFVNMSGDPENEFFSDGLSEEILNALAQVPGLRVPARTSSFAFKGKTQDVVRIAEALRVSTVLEGSVRKAGTRVRITAQLIKAADGYHLWSQTFDRDLKDVFAVQDEISVAITSALKLQLAPPAGGSKKGAPTTNPEAYEAYLKGRQALNERTRASIEQALVQLQKATALDPAYAIAWADTAVAVMLLLDGAGSYGETPLGEALSRARPLLEKAMVLAPDHPGVLAAAGFIEANANQPQRALEFFDRALAINPNSGEVHNWRKLALARLGRYDLMLAASMDAVRSDPLSKIALFNELMELQRFGREAELGPSLARLKGLDEGWGRWAEGQLTMGRGDRTGAVRHLLPALQMGREKSARALAVALADLGLREEALLVGAREAPLGTALELREYARALDLARAVVEKDPENADARIPLFLALYRLGRTAEAATEAARIDHDRLGTELQPAVLLLMADAARTAGRSGDAAAWRDRAERLIVAARRAGYAPRLLDGARARLLAYDGQDGEAAAVIDRLAPALPFPRAELEWPISARLLRRPDVQASLKRIDVALAAQRVEVVALLCGPKRLSNTWQPAPATCAGSTTPR
jgi:TolB-like protein/Flp pilus assembly protein TadD